MFSKSVRGDLSHVAVKYFSVFLSVYMAAKQKLMNFRIFAQMSFDDTTELRFFVFDHGHLVIVVSSIEAQMIDKLVGQLFICTPNIHSLIDTISILGCEVDVWRFWK